MTERRKDLLVLIFLMGILLIFFGRILFTEKIIRAPDIINEFYWGVTQLWNGTLWDAVKIKLTPGWDIYHNSGLTDEGGGIANRFHFYRGLLFFLIQSPASVAWFIVLHFCFGATGVYYFSRLIGIGRPGAFFAGLVFVLSPESASLINAGHVIKIATICIAPWAFWGLEQAFQRRRLVWFMATSVILAFQFFGGHWQIAYYTCLAIGCYGIGRSLYCLRSPTEKTEFPVSRLLGMNLVVIVFFLSTVSISLMPLANWSTDTNRGVQSGANQGKGGLEREEAMSWSLPPEELGAFIIPGFFGLSRQEGGPNPSNIDSYYWGRMVFTQTASYMGLVPWLLLPLPLIFRRDKYTWLMIAGIAGALLFSMGKYTFVYNFLYDHFPGINRFRVPKMMMFVAVMGLAVLAARGVDILCEAEYWLRRGFRLYLAGILLFALGLLLLFGSEIVAPNFWFSHLADLITQPNRFEQGQQLVVQRWNNLVQETAIAAALCSLCAMSLVACSRRWISVNALILLLLVLYLGDVWRINSKFMFLVPVPENSRAKKSPVSAFLAGQSNQYRTVPMDGTDPMFYVTQKVPVLFTSNPVQIKRWQDYLDAFVLMSPMPDILNIRFLVLPVEQYEKDKSLLSGRFDPVFRSPDGSKVVLENRTVMPKAWLVPSVLKAENPEQALAIMQSSTFDPRKIALVESPAPISMGVPFKDASGEVRVDHYEGELIEVSAVVRENSLLVLGEKYYKGWKAFIDGKSAAIVPVNYILRGVYLTPGTHKVQFIFDPLPFKIGKYLTLTSLLLFAGMLAREFRVGRRRGSRAE